MNSNHSCLNKTVLCDIHKESLSSQLRQLFSLLKGRLNHWRMNWRTRQQLAQLNTHLLKDIGLTRGEAQEEASKAFWKD